jgi:hypothetical protein
MVQKQTGAHVVGNEAVKTDMLYHGIPEEKIMLLDTKNAGDMDTKTVHGVRITAIQLTHSFIETIQLQAFLIEMPGGLRFFHGTCSSAASVKTYLKGKSEFYDLDVMMLDYEHDFDAVHKEFRPRHMIKHHEKEGAAWWPDYPQAPVVLHHGEAISVDKRELKK